MLGFHLLDHFVKFLETKADNGLTKSVQYDFRQPFYVGEVKAIACISKTTAKPLFAMLEDKGVDVNCMAEHYRNMIAFLEDAAREPEIILSG